MRTRNCEICGASYSIGKDYGDEWCELSNPKNETKGLCEFCNPNSDNYLEERAKKFTKK